MAPVPGAQGELCFEARGLRTAGEGSKEQVEQAHALADGLIGSDRDGSVETPIGTFHLPPDHQLRALPTVRA